MSGKPDTWMPLFVGDYLGDTTRLTTEQHGAYLLLLMDYWRNGAPPNDDAVLSQITRLELETWKKHRRALERFFRVEGEEWFHKRVEQEIASAKERQEKASGKGKRAADARWSRARSNEQCDEQCNEHAQSTPQAQPEQCPPPSPSPVPNGTSAASSDRADAAEWKLRLEEAKLVGGDGLNLTVGGMHSFADLKALVEPTSGEPCTWLEVVDAIRIEAEKAKTRGRPIRSWTWVHETALAMRDRRLAGLPAPTAPVELSRVRPSAPSGRTSRDAAFVERMQGVHAAMEAAVEQASGRRRSG